VYVQQTFAGRCRVAGVSGDGTGRGRSTPTRWWWWWWFDRPGPGTTPGGRTSRAVPPPHAMRTLMGGRCCPERPSKPESSVVVGNTALVSGGQISIEFDRFVFAIIYPRTVSVQFCDTVFSSNNSCVRQSTANHHLVFITTAFSFAAVFLRQLVGKTSPFGYSPKSAVNDGVFEILTV